MNTDRLLYSRKEVAKLLSVSERTITHLIDCDRLSIYRLGRRTLIHRDELLRFARIDQPRFCL
jgi:excisionase family DNA binding protein